MDWLGVIFPIAVPAVVVSVIVLIQSRHSIREKIKRFFTRGAVRKE